jgi:hypothetical protein
VDLTLGHLEQLLREPRRIEILCQQKIPHFQSEVAYYRRLMIRCSLREERGIPPKTFCHPHDRVANAPERQSQHIRKTRLLVSYALTTAMPFGG